MKINEISGLPLPKINKTTAPAAAGFDKVLEQALTKESEKAAVQPSLLAGLSAAIPVPAEPAKKEVLRQVEGLLGLLEKYSLRMADPASTLNDVYPLVEQLERKSQELMPALSSLPDGDKLKEILNHTLILANVEVMKFNRGDYL